MHFGLTNDRASIVSLPPAHRIVRKECGAGSGGKWQELFYSHIAAVLSVCANVACGAEVARDTSSPVAAPRQQVRTSFL